MVFFAQKVLRKLAGNWTFVVVTDRVELDEQIAKTFKTVGAVSEAEGDLCHAASGAHLRDLLRGNHRYVFTLVHKFQTPEILTERSDVIVLTDEAPPQPIRHAGAQHASLVTQSYVPGFHRHATDCGGKNAPKRFSATMCRFTTFNSRWRMARLCRCSTKTALPN